MATSAGLFLLQSVVMTPGDADPIVEAVAVGHSSRPPSLDISTGTPNMTQSQAMLYDSQHG